MNEKLERKKRRREIGVYGWALLIYYLFLNYTVSITAQIHLIYEGLRRVIAEDSWLAFPEGVMQAADAVMENGWGYIIACAAAVLVIRMWKGRGFFEDMFAAKQDMTVGTFAALLCIFFSGQLVFQILAVAEEMLLNLFDLSVLEAMEMASANVDTFSMFLYMGFAAPVVEEIVFRGLLLRGLEKHGKRFAILASSILFGLFHGNLVQSPYAFAVGLVLGYTAMEYSIGWAMVLHMINNLVLGDSLVRLTSFLPAGFSDLLYWCIYLLSGIAAVVILIRKRQDIRVWFRAHPAVKGTMRAFFTAPANIILMLLMSFNAIIMLFL